MRLSKSTLALLARAGDSGAKLALCYLEYSGSVALTSRGYIWVSSLKD